MPAVHQIVEVMSLHVSDTASGVLEDAVDSPNSPRHGSVLSVLGLWAVAQRCTVLEKDHKQQSGNNGDNNDETMFGAECEQQQRVCQCAGSQGNRAASSPNHRSLR